MISIGNASLLINNLIMIFKTDILKHSNDPTIILEDVNIYVKDKGSSSDYGIRVWIQLHHRYWLL